MSALNLPKPTKTFAGEDELRKPNGVASSSKINGKVNGNGTINDGTVEDGVRVVEVNEEDDAEYKPPRPSDKYLSGIIYPPKEIRAIVDKTAVAITKSPHPKLLEDKIREHQKNDPKFAFLNDEDPYHQYYKYMREKVLEDAEDVAKGVMKAGDAVGATGTGGVDGITEAENEVNGYEPKSWEFRVDLPGVTAMDLDILRLTALFHARRGRAFLSSLSVREGRNYQFDFLRPTHSLYGYYNRMVESYQKIINPPPGLISDLMIQSSDPEQKWKLLEEGRNRAEWEKARRKKEDLRQKQKDEEFTAFQTIDWQDFILVETIEFTQNDMELNLPPPSNMEQLKNRSMGEKRMASMIMEQGGTGPTGGDSSLSVPNGGAAEEEMEMEDEVAMEEEDEEEEEARVQRLKAEQEATKAREMQRAAMESRGMKIRKDYAPKGNVKQNIAVRTAKCPNCGQSIPENELSEHIRIELLDPKWKEQKKVLDSRRQQHQQLNVGADITSSLRNLASARTDLFGDEEDEATRKEREEEERRKRREREKIIWDGHTATASKTTDTFQTQFTLDEQIRKMHSRMGLTDTPSTSDKPVIGPNPTLPSSSDQPSTSNTAPVISSLPYVPGLPAKPGTLPASSGEAMPTPQNMPPALAAGASTPGGSRVYDSATIVAAPSGPITKEYYETVKPSGPSIHPSRIAAMASLPANPTMTQQQSIGQTRPAPTDDGDVDRERPVFKRPKVEKLAFGMYTEVDWQSLHPDPITLPIQLPSMPDKPEWKLNGQIIQIPDLPVNTLFSTVRERIKRLLDADLPISRLQLLYQGKVMSNSSSLASQNLDESDILTLAVKKK